MLARPIEKLKNYSYINRYNMLNGVLRYPRLDTVLVIEKFIKKHDGEYKKLALWNKLPKKMMYQTYCVIIDYLFYSRKISLDSEGKLGWVYYPKSNQNMRRYAHLFWRKSAAAN